MKEIASRLNNVIDDYLPSLQTIGHEKFHSKPSPKKWSKKEILGHLVDSAQNNLRRFIVAQCDERPKIVYNQDKWVAISNYQQHQAPDLVDLWYRLNKHVCHVLASMPDEMSKRQVETEQMHDLKWLAEDYIRHLLHHLHQVLDLEPAAYP